MRWIQRGSEQAFLVRVLALLLIPATPLPAETDRAEHPADVNNPPSRLLRLQPAGQACVRLTLAPAEAPSPLPDNPALVESRRSSRTVSIDTLSRRTRMKVGGLRVLVEPDPLCVTVTAADGTLVQSLTIHNEGPVDFAVDARPILGMGEGGPRPAEGEDWRTADVEFDRRGRLHRMEPRWQGGAYGSRNPVPLLIGTRGWGLFFATPWGRFDLRDPQVGKFTPVTPENTSFEQQTTANQGKHLGKGLPPASSYVEGVLDVFVFDARDPEVFMVDLATISGRAVMPPKWSLGYMQSHRTLEDDAQLLEIVDTFREKRIPLDAVIYLGTGFTPRGWNTKQPSFEFNPEVFKREPADVIADLHERQVKVVVHMVPWDRDRLPMLEGAMPSVGHPALGGIRSRGQADVQSSRPALQPDSPGGLSDSLSPAARYWEEHVPLVKAGVDAWWPDEGDWFDLHERLKRHQLYYEGPLWTQPDRRPWSLHRNGTLGIARWGGWVWSGDTESSWKTLEAQIAVGVNHSLSLGPYWGSDIGGFFPTRELSGELYARWFQFGAFCPSFRSHGRTWWMRLPWGWGLDEMGPLEGRENPPRAELNNPAIEPIARRYAELRYRLLSYNYTLAWEARQTGLPFMRALWLQYPSDDVAAGLGDEYLWGRDLLVAPVYEKGATTRTLYLPRGDWYDWWTGERLSGGRWITRPVDLATLPLYVRAGALLPLDPVRQFTGEKADEPLTLRIHRGADTDYTLYSDDGESLGYLDGAHVLTRFRWDDRTSVLRIRRRIGPSAGDVPVPQTLRIELWPEGVTRDVTLTGRRQSLHFD